MDDIVIADTNAAVDRSISELEDMLRLEHTAAHHHLYKDVLYLGSNSGDSRRKKPRRDVDRRAKRMRDVAVCLLPTTEDAQRRFLEAVGGEEDGDAGVAMLLERVEKENMMLLQSLAILERQASSPPPPTISTSSAPDAQQVSAMFASLAGLRAVTDVLLPSMGLGVSDDTGLLVHTTGGITEETVVGSHQSGELLPRTTPCGGRTSPTPSGSTPPSPIMVSKHVQTFPENQVPLDGVTCPYSPTMDSTYIVRSIPTVGSGGGGAVPTNAAAATAEGVAVTTAIMHRSHTTLNDKGHTVMDLLPPPSRPITLNHESILQRCCGGPKAVDFAHNNPVLADFTNKIARGAMAAGVAISLRPSTASGASLLPEALPSTPRSHLHLPLSTSTDHSLATALSKSNAFRAYLANAVGPVVPPSVVATSEPAALRDMAVALTTAGPTMGYDPLRMAAPVSHMYDGSLTLGLLLVSDGCISIFRDGAEIPPYRKHLAIPKGCIRRLQVGATLSGDKSAPPMSNAIPPPALHFYLTPTIPPSAIQQQFYRTAILYCTIPTRSKGVSTYGDSVQTIVFETESDAMKFGSLMDLDANGARASPFSPFYCPTVQLQKHFGDYGWWKRWGGTGFGELSWLAEGSNSMASVGSEGGAAATAIATSGTKGAMAAGLTSLPHRTCLSHQSMVPLPIRQFSFSKPASLATQHIFPSFDPLLPSEAQLCSGHHIHPRAFSELKAKLLLDPANGSWFSALDVAVYLPPLNGRHLGVHQARVVIEYWLYFSKQIEAVELIEVVPTGV